MNNITKEQINELATGVAMRFHLSEYNDGISAVDAFEEMSEENVIVWQPFEEWELSEVEDSIANLAFDIENHVIKALGL